MLKLEIVLNKKKVLRIGYFDSCRCMISIDCHLNMFKTYQIKVSFSVPRNIKYDVLRNDKAWPFGLRGNGYPGVARRYAPRERLPFCEFK